MCAQSRPVCHSRSTQDAYTISVRLQLSKAFVDLGRNLFQITQLKSLSRVECAKNICRPTPEWPIFCTASAIHVSKFRFTIRRAIVFALAGAALAPHQSSLTGLNLRISPNQPLIENGTLELTLFFPLNNSHSLSSLKHGTNGS